MGAVANNTKNKIAVSRETGLMRIVLLLLASLIPSMPALAATSAKDIAQDMAASKEAPKTTGLDGPAGVLSAAQQGDPDAQFEMGILYEYGFNMPDNEVAALAWYMVAGNANPKAAKRRDNLIGKLPKEKIEAADKLSKTLVTAQKSVPAQPTSPVDSAPQPTAPMTTEPQNSTQIPEMVPVEPMPEPIQEPEKQ
jgi:hypothetical protein